MSEDKLKSWGSFVKSIGVPAAALFLGMYGGYRLADKYMDRQIQALDAISKTMDATRLAIEQSDRQRAENLAKMDSKVTLLENFIEMVMLGRKCPPPKVCPPTVIAPTAVPCDHPTVEIWDSGHEHRPPPKPHKRSKEP